MLLVLFQVPDELPGPPDPHQQHRMEQVRYNIRIQTHVLLIRSKALYQRASQPVKVVWISAGFSTILFVVQYANLTHSVGENLIIYMHLPACHLVIKFCKYLLIIIIIGLVISQPIFVIFIFSATGDQSIWKTNSTHTESSNFYRPSTKRSIQ